jgi:diguanylate cyclase (GGDEF)-like protein
MQRIDEVTAQLQEALDKLDRVSNRDPLTDLYNRRWLLEQAQDEVVRARRDHRPLSVAALDLDRFKCINERFGRPAGDAALAAAAETMRTMMRPSDLIGRTAGEEFCIVMPDTDEKTARRVIERLREAIELCDIPELRGRHLTVSCGVATLERIDSGFSMLLARADDRLQQAKREGCNLVVAAA